MAGIKDLFNGELVGYALDEIKISNSRICKKARLGYLSPAAFMQKQFEKPIAG